MGKYPTQIVSELMKILGCNHKEVRLEEDHKNIEVRVYVDREALDDSMFDEEQFSHIVDSITPTITPTVVEIRG